VVKGGAERWWGTWGVGKGEGSWGGKGVGIGAEKERHRHGGEECWGGENRGGVEEGG